MGRWLKRGGVLAAVVLAVGMWFYSRSDPISKLDIHGTWEPEFKAVADVFRQNLRSGLMRGGSFAAYVDGKAVVNLWGGYTDEEYKLEWKENTITHMSSATKFVTALAFSTLIDKDLVNYDDLVSKHWPEFAQNGKENVTVNMLISHQAGLYALDEEILFKEVVTNPNKIEKILAKQKPAWPPGTAIGYHAMTIGLYVDFLARRVDPKHRPIYQIYDEELRIPLGLDLYVGTPYAEQYRVARVHQPTLFQHVHSFLTLASYRRFLLSIPFGNPWIWGLIKNLDTKEMQTFFGNPDVRVTPIPAATGIGTAVSMAKLFGLVAARTLINGKPLLSERVVTKLSTPSLEGQELTMKFDAISGHGTFIYLNPWGQHVFGHPGAGGQIGYSDATNKVGLAFVTNHFSPFELNDGPRVVTMQKVFYECLGKVKQTRS